MKARPEKIVNGTFYPCAPDEATHLRMEFPLTGNTGVYLRSRCIPVITNGKREGTPQWTWNGCIEKPTLKPSIKTTVKIGGVTHLCHSFVNDGVVKFLPDCTHELKGQTLDLLEIFDDDL